MKKIKIALITSSLLSAGLSFPSYAEDEHGILTHAIESITSHDVNKTTTYYRDLDQDGVSDEHDHCLNTMFGVPVDQNGCELDDDKDGVVNRIDQCPNSAPGAFVNRVGCELDSDGDGVPNSKDKCPRTPKGVSVDAHGCEFIDTDQDLVNDKFDECLDTPLDGSVNRHGCEPHEYVLTNIIFQSFAHDIQESQRPILRKDAALLSNLKEGEVVLITGHTDYTASDDVNLRLSWRRADSTKQFIIDELGHIEQKVYINGYGEDQPTASNANEEGKQENRRIELRVITRDELPSDAMLTLPPEMIPR
ncbi:MAG: thrombospondin type 3 repeat-containing protein [Thiomicrorhabdus sp.]|nr:thrombospondin type 3 repeat-containing protein [Thiomicrorhabdus sp.]